MSRNGLRNSLMEIKENKTNIKNWQSGTRKKFDK